MAIDKKFTDFNDKIKAMKKQALKDVIADNAMTKIEKLEFISQNDLMETASWWCDPFHDKYFDDYASIVIKDPKFRSDYGSVGNDEQLKKRIISDDYFVNTHRQRHETINLADLARDVFEYSKPDDKITIYTNRSTKDRYHITPQQFVDAIYDWVIKNNKIAFELDW